MIDPKIEIYFSEEEFYKLEEIIKGLLPTKMAVDSLYILLQNTELSIKLKDTLILRIKERRNILLDALQ